MTENDIKTCSGSRIQVMTIFGNIDWFFIVREMHTNIPHAQVSVSLNLFN